MNVHNEPLSWLTLERYALGELSSAARRDVEARLASSAEDRAVLESILQDTSELPPLPALDVASPVIALAPKVASKRAWAYASTVLAAAAALLLMTRNQALPPATRAYEGVKGGDVAIALLSDRTGRDPTHFAQGERFKVLLTCPPAFHERARVLVFQGQERFEPLAQQPPACGNLVPWPGAFALTGSAPAHVCIAWGDDVNATSTRQLRKDAVCTTLQVTH